jgi:hypothetical protein
MESSHFVAYSSAVEPPCQFLLIPNDEQLYWALQAAAASIGQAPDVLQVTLSFFACSDLGPILSQCAS